METIKINGIEYIRKDSINIAKLRINEAMALEGV